MNKFFAVATILFSAGLAGAGTFLFSEKGGFQEGNLSGQKSWISEGGFIDFAQQGVILSPDLWKSSFSQETVDPHENTACTISADFSFTLAGEGAADIFGLMINNRPKGGDAVRCLFVRTAGSDNYKFGFKPTADKLYLSTPVPANRIGLGSGTTSDRLTMRMTLERGPSPAGWTVEVELLNTRTGESLSKLTENGVTMAEAIYTADSWYGGFTSSRGDADTGTRDRSVHLFSFNGLQDISTLSIIL